jgi:hypothetical protein
MSCNNIMRALKQQGYTDAAKIFAGEHHSVIASLPGELSGLWDKNQNAAMAAIEEVLRSDDSKLIEVLTPFLSSKADVITDTALAAFPSCHAVIELKHRHNEAESAPPAQVVDTLRQLDRMSPDVIPALEQVAQYLANSTDIAPFSKLTKVGGRVTGGLISLNTMAVIMQPGKNVEFRMYPSGRDTALATAVVDWGEFSSNPSSVLRRWRRAHEIIQIVPHQAPVDLSY